ncbi:MAG: hypothetical protein ACRDSZ_03135 [Pseudonocardiaceae bacterium]
MSEDGWPRWLRWWNVALAGLCAGAAFIAQVLGGASWTITLGGAVATMVAVLLAARPTWANMGSKEDAKKLAKAAVTDYHLTLISVLLPLTDILDRIITAPNEVDRIEAKGAIKQAVVNSFVQFTGALGARSCYFDYEYGNPEKRLACRGIYAGWDSRPRMEFSSADPSHAEIFQLLESRQPELTEDANTKSWFISIPVATSTDIFGLLTLAALHVDNLKQQHVEKMLLLAQLLGIALAINGNSRVSDNSTANGRHRPTRPARSVTRRRKSTA